MPDLHPLVSRILETRGIDAGTFLNPSYDGRHSPFLLKDMDVAVERILKAIRNKEHIAVWHDYDCDGVPGGALLSDFFRAVRYPVRMYVPERAEGYGLNEGGIRLLHDEGVSLLISVDCGITDVEEVALAHELGIDCIVTDHHLPQEKLPPAIAVINSHRADDTYPFKELCGTGVAFKLVEALIERGDFELPAGWEKWLLDLVALATVADMVPLTGENRTFVRWGLEVLHKGRRPGLKALFEQDRVPIETATEDDVAFTIAPKINAASRMASPRLAFELLTTAFQERARTLAVELSKLNKERKIEGMRVAKEVKHRLEAMPFLGEVIVLGSTAWRPSLLGIAATNVVETYRKPVFLWGKEGDLIKGSCRSNGSVNMVSLMTEARHAFSDFGGHEFSGGFSLSEEQVHTLPTALQEACAVIPSQAYAPIVRESEGMLTIAEASHAAYEELRMLAPFGRGNPKPIFRMHAVHVKKSFRFGAHKEHARMTLSDEAGRTLDAIAFFVSRTPFRDTIGLVSSGDSISLEGSLERSHFGGKTELRLRIENLVVR
ncbi:MAG TPA: single-stranded-DNA-specific exonuclease RecJ [Candidatus Paceibacterota bacterium]